MNHFLAQFFFTEILLEFRWGDGDAQNLVLVADTNLVCLLCAYNKIEFLGKMFQNIQGWVCNTEML